MLELLGAQVALVLVLTLTLSVDTVHVPAKTALALELLKTDIAVIAGSLMLRLDVHIATSSGPEVFAAPLARVQLGLRVNGFDVPSHV